MIIGNFDNRGASRIPGGNRQIIAQGIDIVAFENSRAVQIPNRFQRFQLDLCNRHFVQRPEASAHEIELVDHVAFGAGDPARLSGQEFQRELALAIPKAVIPAVGIVEPRFADLFSQLVERHGCVARKRFPAIRGDAYGAVKTDLDRTVHGRVSRKVVGGERPVVILFTLRYRLPLVPGKRAGRLVFTDSTKPFDFGERKTIIHRGFAHDAPEIRRGAAHQQGERGKVIFLFARHGHRRRSLRKFRALVPVFYDEAADIRAERIDHYGQRVDIFREILGFR